MTASEIEPTTIIPAPGTRFESPKHAVELGFDITADDYDFTWDGNPRCTARSQQHGRRCMRAQTPGTHVCIYHGSGAVRRRAQLRLIELVDPAISVFAREMVATDNKPGDRMRAAENVLDRAGLPRRVELDADTARALLLERLLALRGDPTPQS